MGAHTFEDVKTFSPIEDPTKQGKCYLKVMVQLPRGGVNHRLIIVNSPDSDKLLSEIHRCKASGVSGSSETLGEADSSLSGMCILFDSNNPGEDFKSVLPFVDGKRDFPAHNFFRWNKPIILNQPGLLRPLELDLRINNGWVVHLISQLKLKESAQGPLITNTFDRLILTQTDIILSSENEITRLEKEKIVELDNLNSSRIASQKLKEELKTTRISLTQGLRDLDEHNKDIVDKKHQLFQDISDLRVDSHFVCIEYLLKAVSRYDDGSSSAPSIRKFLEEFEGDSGHKNSINMMLTEAQERAMSARTLSFSIVSPGSGTLSPIKVISP